MLRKNSIGEVPCIRARVYSCRNRPEKIFEIRVRGEAAYRSRTSCAHADSGSPTNDFCSLGGRNRSSSMGVEGETLGLVSTEALGQAERILDTFSGRGPRALAY